MDEQWDTDYKKYIIDGIYYYLIWGTQDGINLHTAITEGANFHTVCILGPEEHEPTKFFESEAKYHFFKGYLDYHKKKLVMIMAGANKEYNYRYLPSRLPTSFISWDTALANMSISGQINHNLTPYGHTNIEKAFTSLNNRGHSFRLRFLDYMSKYKLIEDNYVSFHNDNQPIQIDDNYYKFRWWTPRRMNFEHSWRRAGPYSGDYLTPPQEWKRSLWSVICESNTETIFVTEKTWLPVYHKRPFITYSAPFYHKFLKDLGFKLFDEFIDYSFDKVDDDDLRCDMMMQEVSKISKLDHNKVLKRITPILEYNFKHLLKVIDVKNADPRICTLINKDADFLKGYRDMLNLTELEYFKHFMSINNLN